MADTELVNDTISELMQVATRIKEDLNSTMMVCAALIQRNGGDVYLTAQELEAVRHRQVYWQPEGDGLVIGVRDIS